MQLAKCSYFIHKSKRFGTDNPRDYEETIFLGTIFGGVYNCIDLFPSQLFGFKLFDFSLKSNEYYELRLFRFINLYNTA